MVDQKTVLLYKMYLETTRSRWKYCNDVLYRMCEEQPEHKQIDVIVGKMLLIGRSYAAAIERRKNVHETGDDFYYDVVGPKMKEIGPELDDRIAALRNGKGTIADSIEEILGVHKLLVDTFFELTGLEKRSLASKYLHFHCPEKFFIYDSRAKSAIGKLVRKPNLGILTTVPSYDLEYGDFVCRMLELQEYLYEQLGVYESPRKLDAFLLTKKK